MNRNVVGLDIAKQVFYLFMMLDGKAKAKAVGIAGLHSPIATELDRTGRVCSPSGLIE